MMKSVRSFSIRAPARVAAIIAISWLISSCAASNVVVEKKASQNGRAGGTKIIAGLAFGGEPVGSCNGKRRQPPVLADFVSYDYETRIVFKESILPELRRLAMLQEEAPDVASLLMRRGIRPSLTAATNVFGVPMAPPEFIGNPEKNCVFFDASYIEDFEVCADSELKPSILRLDKSIEAGQCYKIATYYHADVEGNPKLPKEIFLKGSFYVALRRHLSAPSSSNRADPVRISFGLADLGPGSRICEILRDYEDAVLSEYRRAAGSEVFGRVESDSDGLCGRIHSIYRSSGPGLVREKL